MWIKVLVLCVMFCILFALGSSLFFLIRDEGKTTKTVKALTWRIALSISLFFFLFIAFSLGWIHPHGLS